MFATDRQTAYTRSSPARWDGKPVRRLRRERDIHKYPLAGKRLRLFQTGTPEDPIHEIVLLRPVPINKHDPFVDNNSGPSRPLTKEIHQPEYKAYDEPDPPGLRESHVAVGVVLLSSTTVCDLLADIFNRFLSASLMSSDLFELSSLAGKSPPVIWLFSKLLSCPEAPDEPSTAALSEAIPSCSLGIRPHQQQLFQEGLQVHVLQIPEKKKNKLNSSIKFKAISSSSIPVLYAKTRLAIAPMTSGYWKNSKKVAHKYAKFTTGKTCKRIQRGQQEDSPDNY
ncbi:hypothetical protein M5K25_011778 [Dendrobium thyrsiflorum]|uniref:Uncharacterized protein n=1 Tax=Dendrobium thyrsiflorum TaxID=117978 RepID=A0ABD0V420_DENTH